jgi:hypothetical protein
VGQPGSERGWHAHPHRGIVRERHRERLNALFDQMIDVIDAFQARKIFVARGVLLDGGPDHYARLEAARVVFQLVSRR